MSADGQWTDEPEASSMIVKQLIALGMNPFGMIRRRWYWMLPALLLGLLATSAIPYVITPQFLSRATVLISSQQIAKEYVRSTVSGLDSLANVNSLMGEVLSQKKLAGLVDKFDLYPDVDRDESMANLIAMMRGSITIQKQRTFERRDRRQETSSIFAITFTYPEPMASADVTNALAGIFVDASIEKRSEQARLTTTFLRRQLNRAEEDMQDINRQITEFRQLHRGEMPGDMQGLIGRLERLETQRQTLVMQIKDAELDLAQLRSTSSPQSESSIQLELLRTQLSADLAAHTDEHPNIIALKRRIERLEMEIASGGSSGSGTAPPTARMVDAERKLQNLRDRLAETDRLTIELDARVSRIPDAEEELGALQERGIVLTENYVAFLRKVQEAELSESLETAQQGPRVTILDPASVPNAPTQSITLLLIAGVGISFVAALGLGLLIELIDPVVLSEDHFEAAGTAPLLGTVRELS